MGGHKFFPLYKDCEKRIDCNRLMEKKLVVDLAMILYQRMIGIMNNKRDEKKIHEFIDTSSLDLKSLGESIAYEDSIAHIIAIVSFVDMALNKRIIPIPVTDGRAPKLKQKKLRKRKEIRENAKKALESISDKTSEEFIKNHKKTVGVGERQYRDVTVLLNAFGLPSIQAPGEADPQCAAIAKSLVDVDGVLAEDSDILLFGSPIIIKGLKRSNSDVTVLELDDILKFLLKKANIIRNKNKLPLFQKFEHLSLVDFHIMIGVDYNEDNFIEDIDIETLFEIFVLNNLDVPSTISAIKKKIDQHELKCIVDDKFLEKWDEVRKYYQDACVEDPTTIKWSLQKPDKNAIYEILKKNNFRIDVIDHIYTKLLKNWHNYYHIPMPETQMPIYIKPYQHNKYIQYDQPDKIKNNPYYKYHTNRQYTQSRQCNQPYYQYKKKYQKQVQSNDNKSKQPDSQISYLDSLD